MSAFLIIALACGYSAIVVWDGPLHEKFIATGIFSGVIYATLNVLWHTAVKQDETDLSRVNLKNIMNDKTLEYKALHSVTCPNCNELNIDRDKLAYCPRCNKLLPEYEIISTSPMVITKDARCPHCGKENSVFASNCWFCGAELPKRDLVKCPSCGAINDVSNSIMWQNKQDSVFCAKCHTTKLPKKTSVLLGGPESGV